MARQGRGRDLIQIYETMLRIRLFEERVIRSYPGQEMKTPVHLCVGQEAVAAGVCRNLTDKDYVFTNHRCHGHCLAKGMSMSSILAELYGKRTGCCKGKSGSMHLSDPDRGILATSAIVGGNIPVAVGAALSLKFRKSRNIAVVFFGDGAVDEGAFYESLNFSALKKLPVLFVCENNFYATNSPQKARQPVDNIFKRGGIFGIKGFRCDGNDAVEVFDLSKGLIEKIRKGSGPYLMECRTYRWKGHVGPDCDFEKGCRPKYELDGWVRKCPVKRLEDKLSRKGLLTGSGAEKMRVKIEREISKAENFAKRSRFPNTGELYEDVYWKG
ncbi:MAG: thiamine pyrophosphate-dependent dehydrogenase E1 component subunit alpha [Candidatus Omnitrophica bacterium]|nr:thiamine pyrophosphate-dependent dehydrogenase E1 component subunit alpha [Candidatus Omnitrophota bacterium]MDD5310186.1 thiamine pyrophosphate-dependent dehydrogenase E1 component subunit alpha [Candidatus Omnitrophota bacterium]MDD5546237.1 thiamine pyrophosphate-dependent dehydrogenase E1 component subunit alpha [Candidatus Omnitrophota bacterium]